VKSNNSHELNSDYDYVIIGSGFGGSVSALRLAEKSYKVLVIEQGKEYKSEDFPKTNWNLQKWMWLPSLRFFGFFKITFLRHIGILSGVGVGGGSLVYANTLPRPKPAFFESGNWNGLINWRSELEPHYQTAEKMLGTCNNPSFFDSDLTLQKISQSLNREDLFEPTNVSVFFGEPDKTVPDPYFNGEGPERSGCTFCGACMTGCRQNAKNTLDKNYLYFALKKGAQILPENKVVSVAPTGSENGQDGYTISFRKSTGIFPGKLKKVQTRGVIFSGGVLGSVRLMLNMKKSNLPAISDQAGNFIRTNNESLILVTSKDKNKDFSEGIAIGSILQVDDDSHLETVRYGKGSNFWKTMAMPLTHGSNFWKRSGKLFLHLLSHPVSWLRVYFMKNFSRRSVILMVMQHLDSTLKFKRGLFNLKSNISSGPVPSASMPLAKSLANKTAELLKGKPFVLFSEAISGTPTTAHILGGAVIGNSPENGVIDKDQKVFGYENMYVCDGAAISANPGVNPALTITAMTERVIEKIPAKSKNH